MGENFSGDTMPPLALLTGGLAMRMRPATDSIPKSLLPVAGEPFIFHQLRLLAREGVRDIVICAGHLGQMIEAAVGDGSAFGGSVRYSYDGDRLLGTGGALRQALPLLGEHFMVLYGDSYLDINYRPVYQEYLRARLPALITVFHNEGKWDTSNIEFAGDTVLRYDKKERTSSMQFIDYGLSVLSAEVLRAYPEGKPFDLAEVMGKLAQERKLCGFEVHTRFYEIGSPAGLAETDAYLQTQINAHQRKTNK